MPASDGSGGGPEPDVDSVFGALADPTRRRLLAQLSTDGPLTATELAASYPVSRQAVVKHLGALAAAGLLDAERQGREVRYGVIAGRLGAATAWLAEVGQRWDDRLEALQRQLGQPAVGSPAVGSPAVGSPAVGSPAVGRSVPADRPPPDH